MSEIVLTNQNKSKSRVGYLSHIGTGLANAYNLLKSYKGERMYKEKLSKKKGGTNKWQK